MTIENSHSHSIKLFLAGDVMTGRGVDQILPHSVDPAIYEPYVKDARDYVKLAERENGKIPSPVDYDYIWGDAMEVWKKENPDFKLINLETSVTDNGSPWPGKGIQYRMHPENIEVLNTANIDFCTLANNHTLDWNRAGLDETLLTFETSNINFAGAGKNLAAAKQPSILESKHGRVIILAYGHGSSGIPGDWAATEKRSGVNFLPALNNEAIDQIATQINAIKKPSDIVVLSVHWGGNWGYDIPNQQKEFAHQLIDEAGVDLIHGHSSHHPQGIEVYNEKLIIYGAGDFINDYEGIGGHEQYRGELTLMYFPEIDFKTGQLKSLKMVPMKIENMQLNYASPQDSEWLFETLKRESEKLNTELELFDDFSFGVR